MNLETKKAQTKTYEVKGNTSEYINKERIYKLYEIASEIDKLKKLRETYIESIKPHIFSKVITNNANWFEYKNGIYDSDLMKGMIELGILNTHHKDNELLKKFIEYGPVSHLVHAIKYQDKTYYIYTLKDIEKTGRTYRIEPVILLNEDLYNIAQIQAGMFNHVTVNDLSKYSEYFKVSNEPKAIFKEAYIEDKYRSKLITLEKYREMLENYEKEEQLVKTLRK